MSVLQSSQQVKLAEDDNKTNVSYEQSFESSQQARVAQSLQAHDYVSHCVSEMAREGYCSNS